MKSDDHAQDELVAGNKNALSLSCELRRPVCGAPSLPPSLPLSLQAVWRVAIYQGLDLDSMFWTRIVAYSYHLV